MSDDEAPPEDTLNGQSMLGIALKTMRKLIRSYDRFSDRLDADDLPTDAELSKQQATVNKAMTNLMGEIHRHEERVLAAEGRLRDAAINLEDVRDTIRRRLDGIRQRHGTGSLSE